MDDGELPVLVTDKADAPALHVLPSLGLRRDDSLALLRTPSGTDLPDFVFATNEHGISRPKVPPSGTLVLNGHLWVDRGKEPLIIELSQPLTVVARGNIYLGRSIGVRGPGKLILVAQQAESEMFCDRNMAISVEARSTSLPLLPRKVLIEPPRDP